MTMKRLLLAAAVVFATTGIAFADQLCIGALKSGHREYADIVYVRIADADVCWFNANAPFAQRIFAKCIGAINASYTDATCVIAVRVRKSRGKMIGVGDEIISVSDVRVIVHPKEQ
jgi:hypothetical protein